MSFILSVVCLVPARKLNLDSKSFNIEEVVQDEKAFARACYIPGLSKYFNHPIIGKGYYILLNAVAGYKTSDLFFPYPEDDSTPVKMKITPEYRHDFDEVLKLSIKASGIRRILVVSEYNGSVTNPDMEKSEIEAVDIKGPLTLQEFWSLHDNGEILEDSIVVIEDSDT